MIFSALAGGTLGFLRYNFNPATVFLGDGGSYFLGYTIAGLSIIGSIKSPIGALMLIPILALGVPLFDTVLAPLRRFVKGKKAFYPDHDHVHHRLLRRKSRPELDWIRPPFDMENYVCSRSIFRLEAPLLGNDNTHLALQRRLVDI